MYRLGECRRFTTPLKLKAWKQELVTGPTLSAHRSLGETRQRPGAGDTMEAHGGHTGRQTVQRVLGADKWSPYRPD
ncbi:hypothetical protein INR49_030436 [Caranx melampygus]|nr:hypothetical protein INR49_030436 [Caranx melampygus]